jgi:hypothetical protein
MVSTQPPIQGVQGSFPEVMQPGHAVAHSPASGADGAVPLLLSHVTTAFYHTVLYTTDRQTCFDLNQPPPASTHLIYAVFVPISVGSINVVNRPAHTITVNCQQFVATGKSNVVRVHVINAYKGSGDTDPLILNVGTRLTLSGQHHALPTLPPVPIWAVNWVHPRAGHESWLQSTQHSVSHCRIRTYSYSCLRYLCFYARSQNCENRLLASSCLPVCPSA